MNAARVRNTLWLLTVAMFLATAVGVIALTTTPLDHHLAEVIPMADPRRIDAAFAPIRADLASLQQVWSLDLRRPLFDPPPPPPATPTPAPSPPPLTVKLAGTIIEPGHSKALFTTPDGKTQIKGIGDKIGEAQVLGIEPDAVTLLHNGKSVVLKANKTRTGS